MSAKFLPKQGAGEVSKTREWSKLSLGNFGYLFILKVKIKELALQA